MRPSLTGIRTPHNRPDAGASIAGIIATTGAAELAYSVMEGVAFQFLDCLNAQRGAGVPVETFTAVGGGSQNQFWVGLIATLFDASIDLPRAGASSAAIGAARLGSVACGDFSAAQALARKPAQTATVEPDRPANAALRERYELFRQLPI